MTFELSGFSDVGDAIKVAFTFEAGTATKSKGGEEIASSAKETMTFTVDTKAPTLKSASLDQTTKELKLVFDSNSELLFNGTLAKSGDSVENNYGTDEAPKYHIALESEGTGVTPDNAFKYTYDSKNQKATVTMKLDGTLSSTVPQKIKFVLNAISDKAANAMTSDTKTDELKNPFYTSETPSSESESEESSETGSDATSGAEGNTEDNTIP